MSSTTDQIKKLGTILGVWAHPDDEVFCCGGIMAMAAANGQRVMCMTATRGEAGVQDPDRWPPDRLGEIRTKELEAAYKELGITEHYWLNFEDGRLKNVEEAEGMKAVAQCIEHGQPDTILTFGPNGLTGHPDHQTVSAWATKVGFDNDIAVYHAVITPQSYEANREVDEKFNMFFNIKRPPIVESTECDLCITLDEATLSKKCQALKAMPSQTERMFVEMGDEKLYETQRIESFVLAR